MLGKLIPDKYFAIWIEFIGDNPTVIAKKRMYPTDDKVSHAGKSHVIDMSKPTYRLRNKFFYFVDYNNGQRRIGKAMPLMDTGLLDDILTRNIARQLSISMHKTVKQEDWIIYLVFALLGAFGSATAMFLYFGGL